MRGVQTTVLDFEMGEEIPEDVGENMLHDMNTTLILRCHQCEVRVSLFEVGQILAGHFKQLLQIGCFDVLS